MMYRIITSTIFLVLVSLIGLSAQQDHFLQQYNMVQSSDSLIVERSNGMKVYITWPFRNNFKKSVQWEQLLEDFQRDLKKILDNVPDYDFYQISYIQNKNLVVEEIRGKETYTVDGDNEVSYIKSNNASLQGDKLKIRITFTDHSELLDPTLKKDIQAAAENVKHVFYFSRGLAERHYYSTEKAAMLPKPKPKFKFFIPLGARLTYLKNKPNVELRYGLGVLVNKKTCVGLMMSHMTQYNESTQRTNSDIYAGILLSDAFAGFGSEFGFMVKNGISTNDDIFMRAGINYRSPNGINLGVAYYLREVNTDTVGENLIWDFKVGFGF